MMSYMHYLPFWLVSVRRDLWHGMRWLCTLFGYESGPKIVSQPAAGLSVAFQPQCNALFRLKAADIKPFLTRGENFKSWLWPCGLFPADLCHHRWDIHSRRNHWFLYIHCFRGLEEDPDWKNVMRTAPHPSSHLIYKCKVASLLAKPAPPSQSASFWRLYHRDQWSHLGTPSNYRAASQLLKVLSGSVCSDDGWKRTITCLLPLSPVSGVEMKVLYVSGFNQFGYLKAPSLLFSYCFFFFYEEWSRKSWQPRYLLF